MLEPAHPNVPLPARIHQTELIPPSTRIIVVGDVHGCFDELLALLRAHDFDPTTDRLVLVGDLVNKGPKSPEVVRFARENGALCVRGNHDDAALSAYYAWMAQSDRDAVPVKHAYVRGFSTEDVAFLEQLPYTITLPHQNALIVHAGLIPGRPLDTQQPMDMYKMRFVARQQSSANASEGDSEGQSWVAFEKRPVFDDSSAPMEVHPWATQWRGPLHVIFGHDAKAGLQREAFATGLDTGCCYGRRLTALILPTHEIVSIPATAVHSPPAE